MALDKFDAAEAEARIYAAWMQAGAFRAGANATREDTFTIMIPPPNVTGALHVGHAFNNTLQDILIRWHRMRGFDTLWQPGQDHAGIATQLQVEKKLKAEGNLRRTDMTRPDFLAKVWEWKAQYGHTIIDQLKRLGCSCDWDRNAFTMSGAPGAPEADRAGNFHDAVIRVFVEMYNKGLIYRGKRLVNWDPHFETAISDLEVENTEVDGHMWHFKYPLAGGATYRYIEKDTDGAVIVDELRDYISIATTRPETMLGDGAVAVHPSDERYASIVGKLCEIPVGPKEHRRLIPIITDEYPDPTFGSGAVKITGAHDFNDYQVAKRGGIPMYRLMDTRGAMREDGAAYAEAAAIAGAVARGERILSEAEADAVNLIPDHLRGLDRFAARKAVVEEITAEGLAVMTRADDARLGKAALKPGTEGAEALVPLVEAKKIMQPFGDRSNVVIEPMLTDQWFVDAEKVVGPALDAVRDGRVKIMPESGEKTYYHWLENIEPWCISRQLWWGHRIPVWYGPTIESANAKETFFLWSYQQKTGSDRTHFDMPDEVKRAIEVMQRNDKKMFCAASTEEALILAKQYYGDAFEVAVAEDRFYHNRKREERQRIGITTIGDASGGKLDKQQVEITHDPDVLDTWFSSGLWPIGTLGWPEQTEELKKYFPTDVLITGQDILFFWVARMMMMQLAVVNDIPFHTVYLHQLVRDEKGQKMSKTKGNVIDPLEIVDEFGADALRFTMAQMAAIGGVLKLSKDRIKGYRNFGTKLWSAASYGEMKGCFDLPHADAAPTTTLTLNNWIKGEVARTRETVDQALAEYRFNDAANALYAFVWNVFCDWYLEFTKPIFDNGTEAEVAETRATYSWVLDQCLILLHPIMPFITEELWGKKARPKMLVHADWPAYAAADLADGSADREMGWVIGLIEAVRSVRAQMHVPAGAKVPLVVSDFAPEAREAYARNEAMILRLARIDSLTEVTAFEKGTATIPLPGATFGLPLAGVIDIAEEKARLEKTLEKLGKELGGLRGRLGNPNFVASAPEEVVIETREALAAREDEDRALRAALARLAELD